LKKVFKWIFIALGIVFIGIIGLAMFSSEEETAATTEETTSIKKEEATEVSQPDQTSKYAEYMKLITPSITDKNLELSSTSYEFIKKNHKLFPAFKTAEINQAKQMEDASIGVKLLNKNVEPYLEKMLSFEGSVISIEETSVPDSDDTMSVVHVMDDEMNSYQVVLFKSSGDILEEDQVQFWGAPIGGSSFENVSGGTTNVQVFMGSHIEKKM